MAREKILFDKTEIILTVVGKKKVQLVNLTCDKITSVSVDPAKGRILGIIPVDSETITVRASGRAEPIVFWKHQEKQFFDSYKEKLADFCKNNRVTFYDNTK